MKCNAVVVEWEHDVVVVDEESGESMVVVERVQFVVWGYIVVVVVFERFPVREFIALVAGDRSPEELDKTMKAVQVLDTEAPGYIGGQVRILYREILRWWLCLRGGDGTTFSFS